MATSSACTHMPARHRAGEVVAAQLGQVAAGGQPQLGRQRLDEHRQQVRADDHPQQQVAELGAGGEVGGEVAGVDVGDRGDERRAEDHEPAPAPARPDLRDGERFFPGVSCVVVMISPRRRRRRCRCGRAEQGGQPRGSSRRSGWRRRGRAARRPRPHRPRRRAGSHAELAEVAQRGAVAVGHALDPEPGAGATVVEGQAPLLVVRRRRAAGSGRRAGRAWGGRGRRRCAPRAGRTRHARAARPRRASRPTARRASRARNVSSSRWRRTTRSAARSPAAVSRSERVSGRARAGSRPPAA